MRISVIVDDELVKTALKLSGLPTKKAVVEAALKLLVQIEQQKEIRKWRGKMFWEGDLEKMRQDS